MLKTICEALFIALIGLVVYILVLRPWLSIVDISSSITELRKSVDALIKVIERSHRDG